MIEYKIVDKLPKPLKDNNKWETLFRAFEDAFKELIAPDLESLEKLISFETIDEQGFEDYLRNFGDYFEVEEQGLSLKDKILNLQLKLLESSYLGSVFSYKTTFLRLNTDFENLRWEDLYAPKNTAEFPYGSLLFTKTQLEERNEDINNYFLTYRGRFSYSNDLPQRLGVSTNRFLEIINSKITKIKPVEIVYDGVFETSSNFLPIFYKIIYSSLEMYSFNAQLTVEGSNFLLNDDIDNITKFIVLYDNTPNNQDLINLLPPQDSISTTPFPLSYTEVSPYIFPLANNSIISGVQSDEETYITISRINQNEALDVYFYGIGIINTDENVLFGIKSLKDTPYLHQAGVNLEYTISSVVTGSAGDINFTPAQSLSTSEYMTFLTALNNAKINPDAEAKNQELDDLGFI